MAIYDPERDRIVLRVVYDGPGRVGKTTNITRLAATFNGEYVPDPDPPDPAGRTRYFEWFAFDGGKLEGHALTIEAVSVPGHKRFEARRAHLLRSADAIVLVCDSLLADQELARETLDSQREHLGAQARQVPLVIQANKQDLPGVLLPHEVGRELGLPHSVPILGAEASSGIGVRETAVQAVRSAVRRIKRQITRGGLASLTGVVGDAATLRAELDRLASAALPEAGPQEDPPPPPRGRRRPAARPTLVREPKAVNIRSRAPGGVIAHNHGELADLASRDGDEPRPPIASDPVALVQEMALLRDDPALLSRRPATPPPPERFHDAPADDLSPRTGPDAAASPPTPHASASDLPDRTAASPADPYAPDLSFRPDAPPSLDLPLRPDPPPAPDLSLRPADSPPRPTPARHRRPASATPTLPGITRSADLPAAPAEPDLSFRTATPTLRDHLPRAPLPTPPDPLPTTPTLPDLLPGTPTLPDLLPGPDPRSPPHTHDLSIKTAATSPLAGELSTDVLHALVDLATAHPEHAPDAHLSSRPGHDPDPPTPDRSPGPGRDAPHAPDLSSRTAPIADPEPSWPPLPRPDVAPGLVWPIPRGREILRALAGLPAERLPTPPRPADDPPLLLAVGPWRLCTRPSSRFASVEQASAALRERARLTRPCAALLTAELALAVQPEPDGGARLWHVVPRLDGIREHLALRPSQARPRVLAALAAAVVAALRLWLRHGVALEHNLGAFAVESGRVIHLGDRIGTHPGELGAALLGYCERLTGDAAALASFTAALELELADLGPEERARLELEAALTRAETRYQDVHLARSRLLAALRG